MDSMNNRIRLLEEDVFSLRADVLGIKDLVKEMQSTLEGLQTFIRGYNKESDMSKRDSNEKRGKQPVSSFGKTPKRGREGDYVFIEFDSSDEDKRTSKRGTGSAGFQFASPSTPINPTVKRKVSFTPDGMLSKKEPTWNELRDWMYLPSYLLNEKETEIFEWVYDVNADVEEIIVNFPSWQQKRETFKCLLRSYWVSSHIMYAWCAYLNVRQTSSPSLKNKDRNFYYCTEDGVKDFLGTDPSKFKVTAALKNLRRDFEIEEYRRWFVATVSKGHWWLYVFDLHEKTVMVLDPIANDPEILSGGQLLTKCVVENVKSCLSHLSHPCMKKDRDMYWKTQQRVDAPQQKNGYDCGAFVMRYMELWDDDWLKREFSEDDDFNDIRHQMAVKMVMSDENIARPWHLVDTPEIDLIDMRENTEYVGYIDTSPVIEWFWEVFQDFSDVKKARLLQFVTGTSKVPIGGFSQLQGISGMKKFQICNMHYGANELPCARTSYNQLNLPEYGTKQLLGKNLLLAIEEAKESYNKKSLKDWRGVGMISS